jgi:hypothetical protein
VIVDSVDIAMAAPLLEATGLPATFPDMTTLIPTPLSVNKVLVDLHNTSDVILTLEDT